MYRGIRKNVQPEGLNFFRTYKHSINILAFVACNFRLRLMGTQKFFDVSRTLHRLYAVEKIDETHCNTLAVFIKASSY